MSLKSVVHPETISKRNLLYRGWRNLITNRFWQGQVPEQKSICLWFWPALFGTFIFTPILYPLIFAIYYPVKYTFISLDFVISLLIEGVMWLFGDFLRIGDFLRFKLHKRLSVGQLLLLTIGIGLAWVPQVNYWWIGTVAVFMASYIVLWLTLSAIAGFFRGLWHLLCILPELWLTAEKYPARQTRFWLGLVMFYLLLCGPILFSRSDKMISMSQWILGIATGLLVISGLTAIGMIREAKREKTTVPKSAIKKVKPSCQPKREPWTRPIGIYLRAREQDFCPIVRFTE